MDLQGTTSRGMEKCVLQCGHTSTGQGLSGTPGNSLFGKSSVRAPSIHDSNCINWISFSPVIEWSFRCNPLCITKVDCLSLSALWCFEDNNKQKQTHQKGNNTSPSEVRAKTFTGAGEFSSCQPPFSSLSLLYLHSYWWFTLKHNWFW